MAEHNELGKVGEDAAAFFLSNLDYRLHERNWRYGHLELDIIAEWHGEYVFVEVKSSRNGRFKNPLDRVDLEKKSNIMSAAAAYLRLKRIDSPFRFDVITVVGTAHPFNITHYKNAFSADSLALKMRGLG